MTSTPDKYTLTDLEAETGLRGRTIRSWISAGVLQRPRGRGRGAHFGEDHLTSLRFIQKVREQVGARMSLRTLARMVWGTDPETIRRVASGEQALHSAPTLLTGREGWSSGLSAEGPCEDRALACDAGPLMSLAEEPLPSGPPPTEDARKAQPASKGLDEDDYEHWTTVEVTEDIALRMRGDDPERVADLARLARRVRAWLKSEGR